MDAPDSTNVSTERVKFDDATSDAFANACRGVAQNIDNTLPGLKSSLTKALEDFEGHYAEITAANIDTAVSDGRDIANILRQLATVVDRLKEAAHKENENRDLMYHYETDWGGFRKWWTETFGGDPPKAEHYVPDTKIDTASLGYRESTESRSSGMLSLILWQTLVLALTLSPVSSVALLLNLRLSASGEPLTLKISLVRLKRGISRTLMIRLGWVS